MREFKGRVIIGGRLKGEAVVSRSGLNPLAAYKSSLIKGSKKAICSDQNDAGLYNKQISDRIICLPQVIGSTSAGLVIQAAIEKNLQPRAFLFSEHIDSLAASGIVLAEIWLDKPIITIDQLGPEFLETIKEGMQVEIKEDGSVSF